MLRPTVLVHDVHITGQYRYLYVHGEPVGLPNFSTVAVRPRPIGPAAAELYLSNAAP